MLLINEDDIQRTGIDWNKTIAVIDHAVHCLQANDFAQPVKPYLRYRNPKNRIIAMPAFVGGNINMAGIKWIASFPPNIAKGIPRAHSVVILNNADTGEPVCMVTTALLSIIRTASVSGWFIKQFQPFNNRNKLSVGITGFGPIGQYHLNMIDTLFNDMIGQVKIYDIRHISPGLLAKYPHVQVVDTWEEAFVDADIFMTCTVSDAPYIDKPPKPGSLHLNVSLRDYKTCSYEWFKDAIFVDDWEEVCREKTDIEMMHVEKGLQKEGTRSITDILTGDCFENLPAGTPVLFNPMGMAVFDIAMGHYYFGECAKWQYAEAGSIPT